MTKRCKAEGARTEVKNQVLMLGNPVAAEVTLEGDPFRTWLWLGPVADGVELQQVQQSRDVDPEDWPDPDHDPELVAREVFPDLASALAELVRRGVDTDAFDAIWRTSNPF